MTVYCDYCHSAGENEQFWRRDMAQWICNPCYAHGMAAFQKAFDPEYAVHQVQARLDTTMRAYIEACRDAVAMHVVHPLEAQRILPSDPDQRWWAEFGRPKAHVLEAIRRIEEGMGDG